MISRNTIDKVFETARVEEVIGDFVQLKRAGSNLKGLSPFSDERSPSFMVSPVKQIWKDFSSGKGGNALTFIMEHEHFTYPEAIRYLAKKYNIEIEETVQNAEEKEAASERESMYLVSEFAKDYFSKILWNTENGKAIAHSYFKERGFTDETIKKFHLGFSPDVWDAFTQEALGKGYQLEFLEKTGLTIVKEDKVFDRFKGRVMFPILSLSGRVLGFGGRILTNDKKAAKYLNSPESDIYHKSKVLYGIFNAKQAIAKQDNCFLVEGYTDVIQMHQAGIENVVASSGTALTPDQIRLINRLTNNITVLFDGDAAGLRASLRGIDLILEAGMNVKVCSFPDGDDPDSFAKKTPFDELVAYFDSNSKDFIQFKASLLLKESNNDPIKKADVVRDMVGSIAKIPDRIKREIYIQETSRIMDISEEVLFNSLAQIIQKDLNESNKLLQKEQKTFEVVKNETVKVEQLQIDVLGKLELDMLSALILYGDKQTTFEDFFIEFNDKGEEVEKVEKVTCFVFERIYLNLQQDEIAFSKPEFKEIYEAIMKQFLEQGVTFDKNHFFQHLSPQLSNVVSDILMNEEKYTLHGWLEKKQVFVKEKEDESVLARLITDYITSFREYLIGKLNHDLMQQFMKQEFEDLEELKTAINDYNRLKVTITRKNGRIRTF
uniref:DNA primase n=1 Tax=Flavobacterium sp. TaxID=239 RepID=UPI004049D866